MADLPRATSIRLQWLRPLALAVTLVFASGNNPAPIPGAFVGFDKLAHSCIFGLLATLLLRVDAVWRRTGWRGWLAILAVSAFGAIDEWHQSFTPGRSVEFADWVADTTGPALAVTLYLNWGWYRRLMETPLCLRRRKADPVKKRTDCF
jgi:VanZ family protein